MSLAKALELKSARLGVLPSGISVLENVESITDLALINSAQLTTGTVARLADGAQYRYNSTAVSGGVAALGGGYWIPLSAGLSEFNVRLYGAVGDNATDDSASIQAAIDAAIANSGGVVVFPAGRYRGNVSVVGNNVTFRSVYGSPDLVAPTAFLGAYSALSPTLTIGDGVTVSRKFANFGVSILGTLVDAVTQATAALRLQSCIDCMFVGVTIVNGVKTIWAEGSATQPATCINFFGGNVRQDYNNAASRGLYVRRHAGSYTTGLYFSGTHFNGGVAAGFIIDIDGEIVRADGVYIDFLDGHGVSIGAAAGGGGFRGSYVLDGAGVAVTVYENVRNIARYIAGQIQCDVGTLKYLDATTVDLAPYSNIEEKVYAHNINCVDTTETVTLKVNGGTGLGSMLSATAVLNFPLVAAGGKQDLTIALPGVVANDTVNVSLVGEVAGPSAGLICEAWVSAPDVVTVRVTNITAVGIDPAGQSYRVVSMRF